MNEKLKNEILAGLQKIVIMQGVACTHCPKFATCIHLTEKFVILDDMQGEMISVLNKPMGELVATLTLANVLDAVCEEIEMIAVYNKKANMEEYKALMVDIDTLEILFDAKNDKATIIEIPIGSINVQEKDRMVV